jgi:ABC-type Fe3+-hydroxamate transport system substrate-binding protein
MILDKPTALQAVPKRIVSLVPSQTELLHQLGLEAETVGITKFCVHPSGWLATKKRVGGTKTVNKAIIDQLLPDLIIANKEENVKEQVEELALHYPVWLTDVNNFEEALQMIADVGIITGKQPEAKTLAAAIDKNFYELEKLETQNPKPKTAYLIWRNPYMAAGGDTFINDMLNKCGFENIFAEKNRYPQINIAELQTANCKLLLLSSEPYPFKQKHIDELQNQLPGTKIVLVDGEMFSWYGSRLLQAPGYFNELIHNLL